MEFPIIMSKILNNFHKDIMHLINMKIIMNDLNKKMVLIINCSKDYKIESLPDKKKFIVMQIDYYPD